MSEYKDSEIYYSGGYVKSTNSDFFTVLNGEKIITPDELTGGLTTYESPSLKTLSTGIYGGLGVGKNLLTNKGDEKSIKEKVLEFLKEKEVEVVDGKIVGYIKVKEDELEKYEQGGYFHGVDKEIKLNYKSATHSISPIRKNTKKAIKERLLETPNNIFEVEVNVDDLIIGNKLNLLEMKHDVAFTSKDFKVVKKAVKEPIIKFSVVEISKAFFKVNVFNDITGATFHLEIHDNGSLTKKDIIEEVKEYLDKDQRQVELARSLDGGMEIEI